MEYRVLNALIAKAESLEKLKECKKTFLIVSRSGFQKSLLKMKKENVILLDLRQTRKLTAMPADLSDIALAKSEALAKVGWRLTGKQPLLN